MLRKLDAPRTLPVPSWWEWALLGLIPISNLRAFMAGIAVPSPFMLVVFTGFIIGRFVLNVPIPIERVIIFPVALVPNLWGLWSVLYVALFDRGWLPIGLHGALLPVLLLPCGYLLTRCLDVVEIPLAGFVAVFPAVVAIYYLGWKFILSWLNRFVGVA